MARILVISGDILPYPGLPTTGAGLRAWGLGQGLQAKGHQVIMAMPEQALAFGQQGVSAFDGCLYRERALAALIERQQPEVVIVQHWRLANFLPADLETPVVIDLHGPLLLEVLFQEHPAFATLQRDKLTALQRADFFTCAGEKQRYYFESWLLMAGVDLRQDVLRVIPVSLSPDLPAHASGDDLTFVYGGVFNWQYLRPCLKRALPCQAIPLVQALRAQFQPSLRQYAPRPLRLPRQTPSLACVEAANLPVVSIVTPSFNHAPFLARTICSVLDQEYPKLEYIIQDGGSTDGTLPMLKTFRAKLTHVESCADQGQADAINLGFRHATGEIMAWLNSDDVLCCPARWRRSLIFF